MDCFLLLLFWTRSRKMGLYMICKLSASNYKTIIIKYMKPSRPVLPNGLYIWILRWSLLLMLSMISMNLLIKLKNSMSNIAVLRPLQNSRLPMLFWLTLLLLWWRMVIVELNIKRLLNLLKLNINQMLLCVYFEPYFPTFERRDSPFH